MYLSVPAVLARICGSAVIKIVYRSPEPARFINVKSALNCFSFSGIRCQNWGIPFFDGTS